MQYTKSYKEKAFRFIRKVSGFLSNHFKEILKLLYTEITFNQKSGAIELQEWLMLTSYIPVMDDLWDK